MVESALSLGLESVKAAIADIGAARFAIVAVTLAHLAPKAREVVADTAGGQLLDAMRAKRSRMAISLACIRQVTDSAPDLPQMRHAQPDSERGRGLQIVAALATDSGITAHAHGKTAWFTLTASPELELHGRQADWGAEASA